MSADQFELTDEQQAKVDAVSRDLAAAGFMMEEASERNEASAVVLPASHVRHGHRVRCWSALSSREPCRVLDRRRTRCGRHAIRVLHRSCPDSGCDDPRH